MRFAGSSRALCNGANCLSLALRARTKTPHKSHASHRSSLLHTGTNTPPLEERGALDLVGRRCGTFILSDCRPSWRAFRSDQGGYRHDHLYCTEQEVVFKPRVLVEGSRRLHLFGEFRGVTPMLLSRLVPGSKASNRKRPLIFNSCTYASRSCIGSFSNWSKLNARGSACDSLKRDGKKVSRNPMRMALLRGPN
jgi:hypothetical protein